jgi:hypothetical protein
MISLISSIPKCPRAFFQSLALFILTNPGRTRFFRKAQILGLYTLSFLKKSVFLSVRSLDTYSRRRQIKQMLVSQLNLHRNSHLKANDKS